MRSCELSLKESPRCALKAPLQRRCPLANLFCVGGLIAVGFGWQPVARADHLTDTQPAPMFAGQVRNAAGEMVGGGTADDTPLYRAGTDPLTPLTDVNGDPITWGQFKTANGELTISHVPGGGTAMSAEMSGLIPGELYSFWAGYFDPFPMNRSAFGAMTENGLGTDHYGVADSQGNLTLDVVHQAGPGTVQGEILAYAPYSPTGYDVGLALHFGDYPEKDDDPIVFLAPGDIDYWALSTLTHFPHVPEPSSIVLAVLAVAAGGVAARRKRNAVARSAK